MKNIVLKKQLAIHFNKLSCRAFSGRASFTSSPPSPGNPNPSKSPSSAPQATSSPPATAASPNLQPLSASPSSQLVIKLGETVVVHWTYHCVYDVSGSDFKALKLLALIKPNLITIVVQDLSHGGIFIGRFVEALHYYSVVFDALGDELGPESIERHTVKQQVLGGEMNVQRWADELGGTGFQPISLAGNQAAQASLLLKMFPWQGYTLVEENGYLKLGWKDLSLLTASA